MLRSREFLRRYEQMPQVKKAELIEGVVYMGCPVSVRHAKPDALIQGWLVAEARLEWSCLEEDDYRPQMPDAQGVLHCRVFPGLQLPAAPLLAGDTAKLLATLTGPGPLNTKPLETSGQSEG